MVAPARSRGVSGGAATTGRPAAGVATPSAVSRRRTGARVCQGGGMNSSTPSPARTPLDATTPREAGAPHGEQPGGTATAGVRTTRGTEKVSRVPCRTRTARGRRRPRRARRRGALLREAHRVLVDVAEVVAFVGGTGFVAVAPVALSWESWPWCWWSPWVSRCASARRASCSRGEDLRVDGRTSSGASWAARRPCAELRGP
ncbi:hypothetical protein QJS66_04860 [Kocuria rhizophila]|nr:hypothetical protein QJS66_04860 [Kocuria rhizophila]